jgi:hypothetical protein
MTSAPLFTLIFNMDTTLAYARFAKYFTAFVVVSVLIVGGTAYTLYTANIPYTENDLLLTYQLDRLATSSPIDTLIVGDSSVGNAISEDMFSKSTGTHALNVALTGSFGIEGSYNMIRQALRLNHPLKYIVIVQSLDIWRRPFAEQGVISTERGLPSCAFRELCIHPLAMTKYIFNPKQILWTLQASFNPPELPIDDAYRKQNEAQYGNGGIAASDIPALSPIIDPSKQEAVSLINQLCSTSHFVCVYLHGPLHEGVVAKSKSTIAAIDTLLETETALRVSPSVLELPNEDVGDSLDHASPAYKSKATLWYAAQFLELTHSER